SAATGKLAGTQGAYRNPSPLPDGRFLVSYAADVTDLAAFDGGFDIVIFDPQTERRVPVLSNDDNDLLWPVAVYARQPRHVFRSRIDEANGATRIIAGRDYAEILFLDVPLMM